MKRLFLLCFALAFSALAAAGNMTAEECYQCSAADYITKSELLAVEVLPTGRVFLLDRYNDVLKKYLVYSEPTDSSLSSTASQPPQSLEAFLASEGVRRVQVVAQTAIQMTNYLIDVIEINPTNDEITTFNNFDDLAEDVLSIYNPLIRAAVANTVEVTLPPNAVSGAGSAYDVIGNYSLGLSVGSWVTSNHTNVIFFKQVLEQVLSMFSLKSIQLYEFNVRVTFPDGSSAVWDVNTTTSVFAPLFETFMDSDNNQIPLLHSDAEGRAFNFADGIESSNMMRMESRLQLLGFETSGGGGSSGGACTWSCGVDACSLTCSLN